MKNKYYTSFAKYNKKDRQDFSMLHEITWMIEVRGVLRRDVRGCKKL